VSSSNYLNWGKNYRNFQNVGSRFWRRDSGKNTRLSVILRVQEVHDIVEGTDAQNVH
jgi:hypothetical protein